MWDVDRRFRAVRCRAHRPGGTAAGYREEDSLCVKNLLRRVWPESEITEATSLQHLLKAGQECITLASHPNAGLLRARRRLCQ